MPTGVSHWSVCFLFCCLRPSSYTTTHRWAFPEPLSPHWPLHPRCGLQRDLALHNEAAHLYHFHVYGPVLRPLSFNLICYLKTVICLHRRNEKEDRKRETEGQLNENKRINTMLISIVVMFGACWLPLNIVNVICDWCHEVLMSCYHDLVVVICHLIAMLSTCINPLFYGFLNKNFQKDLVVLIHHCWRFAPQERYRKCCRLHYAHRWIRGIIKAGSGINRYIKTVNNDKDVPEWQIERLWLAIGQNAQKRSWNQKKRATSYHGVLH